MSPRVAAFIAVCLLLSACRAAPSHAQPGSSDATGVPVGPSADTTTPPPSPPQVQQAATGAQTLTERLVQMPALTIQPVYRWSAPPEGYTYQPLPSGLMVQWTTLDRRSKQARPFTLSVRTTGDQALWSRTWDASEGNVRSVDVSPERIAVVDGKGNIQVLSVRDGQPTAVADKVDEETEVGLVAGGRYLTFQGTNPRTLFRYWLTARELTGRQDGDRFSVTGWMVGSSPYSDLLMGQSDTGLEVRGPGGLRGTIPYQGSLQDYWEFDFTADGQLIYVYSSEQDLAVYGRDLKLRWRVSKPTSRHRLAAGAGLLWSNADDHTLEVRNAAGQVVSRLVYDPKQVVPTEALPGGELIVRVSKAGVEAKCLVTPQGQVVGCLHSSFASALGSGGPISFFWTEVNGTVQAYRL